MPRGCFTRSRTSLLQGSGKKTKTGFGALGQVNGRTAIPFLNKYVVPAARRIDADMLQFAVPEISHVVSGKQNIKAASKDVGRPTSKKNNSVVDCRKRTASKVIQSKSKKWNSRSRRDIFTNVATGK